VAKLTSAMLLYLLILKTNIMGRYIPILLRLLDK
jgi:hypothetical protein